MKISAEDIKLIRKFEEIKNKGYYCSGEEVTRVYNRVLEKNLNTTNCSSCLRGRIQELVDALNAFEAKIKAQEALKQQEPTPDTPEENKPIVEEKKRAGKKK